MGLPALAIKAAKGRNKQYKLADYGGLYLLVLPLGQRYWRMNYRHQEKYKTLAFGVWPDVELADARAKRDEARRVLARGIDPSGQMKLDKITASVSAANTFRAVAEEWYAKSEKEGLAPATLNKVRWLLTFAYASFGNRPIAEILPHELLVPLRKIEARGKHESARRLRSTCGPRREAQQHGPHECGLQACPCSVRGMVQFRKRGCTFGRRQLRSIGKNREQCLPFSWLDIVPYALASRSHCPAAYDCFCGPAQGVLMAGVLWSPECQV